MTYAEIVTERTYCLGLLQAQGNANVPTSAVPSYLRCQAINADKAQHAWLARAYRFAAKCVGEGDWTSAWQALNFATN